MSDAHSSLIELTRERVVSGRGLPAVLRRLMRRDQATYEILLRLASAKQPLVWRVADCDVQTVEAARCVAHLGQEDTFVPWLERLFRDGEWPTLLEREWREAERQAIDVKTALEFLSRARHAAFGVALLDVGGAEVTKEQCADVQRINERLKIYSENFTLQNLRFRLSVEEGLFWKWCTLFSFVWLGTLVLNGFSYRVASMFALLAWPIWQEAGVWWRLRQNGLPQRTWLWSSSPGIFSVIISLGVTEKMLQNMASGFVLTATLWFGALAFVWPLMQTLRWFQIWTSVYARLERMGKVHFEHDSRTSVLWRAWLFDARRPAEWLATGWRVGFAGLIFYALSFVVPRALVQSLEIGLAFALLGTSIVWLVPLSVSVMQVVHRKTMPRLDKSGDVH